MDNKKTRIERMLEPFGARHGKELVVFFDKISLSNFDVIIFMARKALCLFRLMDLCGARKPKAVLYSDAVLDTEISFLNKRVLVVDDTLFVGTTLDEAKKKLRKHQVKVSEFWVYCVDIGTWQETTFKPDYIHTSETSQSIIELCAAECRALINAGIPYLADFAESRRIHLYPSELNKTIKPINWYFYDISSQYHESNKVKYYSALPDNYIQQEVINVIGAQIFDLIEIAKIRIFATWTGTRYETVLVPVVTFGTCKASHIKHAAQALLVSFKMDASLIQNSRIKELVRVLQFLVGSVYLKTFYTHLEKIKTIKSSEKLDYFVCSTVFNKNLATAISKGIANNYQGMVISPPTSLPPLRTNEPSEIVNETRDDISNFLEEYFTYSVADSFQDTPLSDLTAIFLEFHSAFEKPAREEIKQKVRKPIYRDRLKRGMAWGALSACMLDKHRVENTRYKRNLLSLILDKLIDYGIAVPIITNSNGMIYRAYRHGEDVRYGAQEESLIYKILEGFQRGRDWEGIERTYLEKLIVVLLRVGMNEEWLNLWYSRSGRDNLVRVGFNLQGAVPIAPKSEDELIPESETSWLTRRLVRVGTIIEPTNKGGRYTLGEEPEAAHARKDAGRTARLLGYAIGKACISGKKARTESKPIATEDLIIITSCSNLPDTVAAVAAEMKLFANWYRDKGRRLLLGYEKTSRFTSGKLTVSGSDGEEAVNSGTWKIRKYENKAIEIIKSKLLTLRDKDSDFSMFYDHWDAIFQAFDRHPNEEDKRRLRKILESSKRILNKSQSALDYMELLFRYSKDNEQKDKINNRLEKINQNPYAIKIGDPDFIDTIDCICSEKCRNVISNTQLRSAAKLLDNEILTLVEDSKRESEYAASTVLKSDKKLGRVSYRYLIWYDILDVRVRKRPTPDSADNYALAINEFRALTNSMLADYLEYMRETGGDLFCDTGDINSINDEKHIFINAKGSGEKEGFHVVSGLVKAASQAGVCIRLIATPTNLRGDYTYLNRGENSIDGDFKSHVHTLIQDIKSSELENSLRLGESILWLVNKSAERFSVDSGIDVRFTDELKHVQVNIRGFKIDNVLTPVICST